MYIPYYCFYTTLISAKKFGANGTIQVGFGGVTQNVVGAKLYEHRDNVAILELAKKIDFANPACLGKTSKDAFVLTAVSNDRLIIKDGEGAASEKCSSRRKNERCIKVLGGFPCTTILGGN